MEVQRKLVRQVNQSGCLSLRAALTATKPEFKPYCMSAITHSAITNVCKGPSGKPGREPNEVLTTVAVIAVEQAITPALKRPTSGRLLKRMVEVKASIDASNT